jgi:hypothetical protein
LEAGDTAPLVSEAAKASETSTRFWNEGINRVVISTAARRYFLCFNVIIVWMNLPT